VQEIEKDYPRVKFAEEGPQVIKREFVEKLEYAKFSPRFSPFHSTLVASWVISLVDFLFSFALFEAEFMRFFQDGWVAQERVRGASCPYRRITRNRSATG
jgi:hypothetical protein